MGINQQQQSTSERGLFDIKQKDFSNETINFGESGIEALKRSKRNPIPIPIITVAVRKLLQKWIQQYTLPVADTGWSWSRPNEEFKSLVTGLSDDLKSIRENFNKSFVDLDDPITCKNEQVFDATKKFRAILGFIQKIVDDPQAIQNISAQVAENYWAINRNYELLLDNHIASQALLLTNAGFLMGITSISMMTNSQLDRSYETTKVVEAKVDRNYDVIKRAESKVDRNLEVMLSGLKALECNFGNMIEKKFREVINSVRHTKIEGITSELITVIRNFIHEKNAIRNLTHDQYITKFAEINGILSRLQNSRMPQSGSLHTLLYGIINQRFAIPENSDDKIAFTALGLLCFGTETYISIMSFLLEEYSYLADLHYQESDVEKYNHYFSSILTTFNDFKDSLVGNDGLIDAVVNILNEVKSYDFIKDEREDIVKFVSGKIDYLSSVKSQLIEISVLSQEKPARKIKYDFSNSQVNTPIGKWQDGRKVSYAVQFQDNDTYYPIGEWSTPYTVYGKANPLLDIGSDPQGRTRLIFRKFDNDKPELVGIVEDSNQREFRDISRDFYNAASEPNENMAINEMEILLENGANVNARYKKTDRQFMLLQKVVILILC
ncbi:MAG TPA: hypothetical protein DEQ74_03345 [Wolbachia sp.]|jgi:hypothetical protein|uniref:hypothetical protein n=1 Tax=Wolbachia endosymbiont of Pentalonia nigronervosa TaxID=1301914 RepID=UPI000EBB32BF|nr:hypothetical protein [Wolbachia endosymbiont of Pentalonia nigronervosa]MBD0391108.1 hypothetical protein [Wolbachia endosymbiont of Pentalonia nigronervosa]HCE59836.1 hypothetical protein [Wolbachia sp.]